MFATGKWGVFGRWGGSGGNLKNNQEKVESPRPSISDTLLQVGLGSITLG